MALLTVREKGLLKEIYEVPAAGSLVIAGENAGVPSSYLPLSGNITVTQRLTQALAALDLDINASTRVSEILATYDQYALDPSNIDRNGYQFRFRRNMKAIYKALMPYTGILIQMGTLDGGRTPLG